MVHALRSLALVGLLHAHPSLREDVPHGVSERLELLAWISCRRIGGAPKEQLPIIERIWSAGQVHRAEFVLATQSYQLF
jgi:hypothetical protein